LKWEWVGRKKKENLVRLTSRERDTVVIWYVVFDLRLCQVYFSVGEAGKRTDRKKPRQSRTGDLRKGGKNSCRREREN